MAKRSPTAFGIVAELRQELQCESGDITGIVRSLRQEVEHYRSQETAPVAPPATDGVSSTTE